MNKRNTSKELTACYQQPRKGTGATAVITLLLLLPWTIFILRSFRWALESPAAEIIIGTYAAAMILMAAAAIIVYVKGRIRNNLMKAALVIHCIYAGVGLTALLLMVGGMLQ